MRAPDFWDRKTGGFFPTLLRPIGALVAAISAVRQKFTHPWRAPVPIICIGNLVAGGAGKTPVAIDIAQRLSAHGVAVHMLTRGYGGSLCGPVQVDVNDHTAHEVGDEALLLARVAPTWIAHKRRDGIEAAVKSGAQIIVMDDGFQNPAVAKDLSLVVVDGGYGFGNGRVMPAGPLRERIKSGLARADAVILLGADEADVWGRVQRLGFKTLPVIRARLEPCGDVSAFQGRNVYAFAGIGRPQKFFDTLRALGCTLVGCKAFDDHHAYRDRDIQAILDTAGEACVITTAKDFVRLPTQLRAPVHVLEVALSWKDDTDIENHLKAMVRDG